MGPAAAAATQQLDLEGSAADLASILVGLGNVGSGVFQRTAGRGGVRLQPRPMGQSSDEVFPLPLVVRSSLPRRGRARLRAQRRAALSGWVNSVIVLLNLMMTGREGQAVSRLTPTAAQQRVQRRLVAGIRNFLRDAPGLGGEDEMQAYLKDGAEYQLWLRQRTLPLGARSGVPDHAGTVDLAAALDGRRPVEAEQVREPRSVLLPPSARPLVLKRPFIHLDNTYPSTARRTVRVGCSSLAPRAA